MRRSWNIFIGVSTFWLGCHAAFAFEPKPDDVCPLPEGKPNSLSTSGERNIDRHLLIEFLFKEHKIFPIDIDKTGNFSRQQEFQALLGLENYCKDHPCAKGAVKLLGEAQEDLRSFLEGHASAQPPKGSGFQIRRLLPSTSPTIPGMTPDAVPLEEFLDEKTTFFRSVCLIAADQPTVVEAPASGRPTRTKARFVVRAKIEDLSIDRGKDPAGAFKKLDRAGLSLTADLRAHSEAVGINGVVGWSFARAPIGGSADDFWQAVLFATYNRQYVDTLKPGKSQNINNIGAGLLGDVLFYSGIHHDLQFSPKFVHSIKSDADIFSTGIIYTPEPSWPGIGSIWLMCDETIGVQFSPQVRLVLGDVIDDGGDPNLSKTKDFGRVGPHADLRLLGWEGSVLDGLSLSASYDYQQAFRGQLNHVDRFEASLNYAVVPDSLFGFQVKYVNGRDLDTLEKQETVTLGVGVKY